jgi:hypothetical protein
MCQTDPSENGRPVMVVDALLLSWERGINLLFIIHQRI